MATLHRTESGVAYIKLTWLELAEYSGNMRPICDFCIQDLTVGDITLVPILNQALCPKCAREYLQRAMRYPEDAAIEQQCEAFWKGFYDLHEEGD